MGAVVTAVTWWESAQRGTWLAELNGVLLAVARLGVDRWESTAGDAHGPVQKTRLRLSAKPRNWPRPAQTGIEQSGKGVDNR